MKLESNKLENNIHTRLATITWNVIDVPQVSSFFVGMVGALNTWYEDLRNNLLVV